MLIRSFLLFALMSSVCYGDVAFLAAPRTTGRFHTQSASELDGPYRYQPAAQLIVLGDGTERVLIDGGALDLNVSHDGQSLLVSRVEEGAANVYRINVATGEQTKLTAPSIGAFGKPVWNCQAVEAGGGIAFLSNRDGWMNPHEKYRAFTIYWMKKDGSELRRIWHAGLGGVFGLAVGPDGRLYFATAENQGLRSGLGNMWAIWSINPDGSDFRPEVSAIGDSPNRLPPFDWPCVSSDRTLLVAAYYDTNEYGTILPCPVMTASFTGPPTHFGHPLFTKNPPIANGPEQSRFGFQRRGMYSLFPWATTRDIDNPGGLVSHPAPAPGNGAYYTHTGLDGRENHNLGVFKVADITKPVASPADMVAVVDRADRHEWMGRPIVPFSEIYSISEPPTPTCAKDDKLPPGSPFFVLGTSSLDINEIVKYTKRSVGYTPSLYEIDAEEIEYIRILGFNPTMNHRYNDVQRIDTGGGLVPKLPNYEGFHSQINERAGYYGEVPVKKWLTPEGELHLGPNPPEGSTRIMREDGRPDTSFLCELPANQSWTFQLLNAKKEAISGGTANTWHQGTPGERMTNCSGCHAHWAPDQTPFENTEAASERYRELAKRFTQLHLVVRDRDLPASVPSRPWASGVATVYQSDASTIDDDPSLTPEQQELVRAWIDTGMLEAGKFRDGSLIPPGSGRGPYQDTMEPTLVVEVLDGEVAIGAHDPHSGLKGVTVNDEDVTKLIDPTHTLIVPLTEGPLVVIATDNAGNEYQIERTIEADNSEEIAELERQIATLKEQLAALVARLEELLK